MKLNSIRQATVRAAALGLCGVALASAPAARAEDKMTAQKAGRTKPPFDPRIIQFALKFFF